MAEFDLTPAERERLTALAEGSPAERLRRRARIVLLSADGRQTFQVAAQVGLSRSQVRYWKRRWRLERMAMFPPAEGRAAQPPQPEVSPGESAPPAAEAHPLRHLRANPPAARRPGLHPKDPMAEAGRKVLRFHFARMLASEEGTRQGTDIEALHNMRVATRRMRAAFDVFRPWYRPRVVRPFIKGLRATGRALGDVRDLDVFMAKAQTYLKTLPEAERGGLEPLLEAWQARREQARARMLAYLDGEAYARFVERFYAFLENEAAGLRKESPDRPARVREAAPVLIYERLAHVLAYEPLLEQASIEQLHALRIAFKRLRYTLEFFREVLGPQAAAALKDIKAMQDHLGDLNDADVACDLLNRFLADWDERQRALPLSERQNPEPLVAYLAVQHARRHRLMTTFPRAWRRTLRPAFRRSLALAVAEL